jgi:glucans biosynthesis protein
MTSKPVAQYGADAAEPALRRQDRLGSPCQSPAVGGKKRCRMHGGAPGSGVPRGDKQALKHGAYTQEAIERRKGIRVRRSRDLIHKMSVRFHLAHVTRFGSTKSSSGVAFARGPLGHRRSRSMRFHKTGYREIYRDIPQFHPLSHNQSVRSSHIFNCLGQISLTDSNREFFKRNSEINSAVQGNSRRKTDFLSFGFAK